MVINEIDYWKQQNWLLAGVGGVIFLMAVWMVAETAIVFCRHEDIRESQQAPLRGPAEG